MSERISILIKTFERKDSLVVLLDSFRRRGVRSRILIADDSRRPYGKEILESFSDLDIAYHELPYDVGLSAGRNRLLEDVDTDLFLLLDDDYFMDETTDLESGVRLLEHKRLDVLGGLIYDYKSVRRPLHFTLRRFQAALRLGLPFTYLGQFAIDGDSLTVRYFKRNIPDFIETDIVPNFFLARTEKIRAENRWDEHLKFDEHTEFFLRAKLNGLRVAFTRDFAIRHYPVRLPHYVPFTDRGDEPLRYIQEKHSIRVWRAVRDDGETLVRTLTDGRLETTYEFERSFRGRKRRRRRKRQGRC